MFSFTRTNGRYYFDSMDEAFMVRNSNGRIYFLIDEEAGIYG